MSNSNLWVGLLVVGPIQTNCYIVKNEELPGRCVLVDPGDDAERILTALSRLEVRPEAILLTHAHFDHIQAVNALKEAFPEVVICLAEKERALAENPELSNPFQKEDYVISPDRWLQDGDELSFIGCSFTVLASPGHTAGSVCYYLKEQDLLFAGDTIFLDSCGRTDLPTGSEQAMRETLQRLLSTLPPQTAVYPGHGPETTVEHERDYLT
ncbi:MAG: MBL fold metallo-hydrolase [Lachnospiraceae bacterium]|nr:MBL fold metallo-hydrolase [Lachnospiraceae bacterium]